MEEKFVLGAVKLLVEVLDSEEYDDFENRIKCLMNGCLPLLPESTFVVSVKGKIVDQAKNLADLIGSDLTRSIFEKIDELGTVFFADMYNVQEWADVCQMYDPRDFAVLSQTYKKMSDDIFLELKYKANPYEDENVQGVGDKTITFLNFESVGQYARYLVLEGIENIQLDLKSEWKEEGNIKGYDEEGYPIIDDEGPFGEYEDE